MNKRSFSDLQRKSKNFSFALHRVVSQWKMPARNGARSDPFASAFGKNRRAFHDAVARKVMTVSASAS